MGTSANKPTIILITSNGVGMGHLARATAIARELKNTANPIILSMAGAVAEIPEATGIPAEYIPGRDRGLMDRKSWDQYLCKRILALVDETRASIITFDGVVPYAGVIAARLARPNLTLVWIRRGLWKKTPQRFALNLQSKLMDYIIEPGDYARAYDFGPTSNRKESILVSPVSLFKKTGRKTQQEAKEILALDITRPAVLVQLGSGDADMNFKMIAILKGLLNWPNLQVVMTKNPIDSNGNSLAPEGLDIKVIRYFPLADVLTAFDASVCASGYNGVHENLAAGIPTVFFPNIRGTDDQNARARWCENRHCALMVEQSDSQNIEKIVGKLYDKSLRSKLTQSCEQLPEANGAREIAETLLAISHPTVKSLIAKRFIYNRLIVQTKFSRGVTNMSKQVTYEFLRKIALSYRTFFPHKEPEIRHLDRTVFSETKNAIELRELIQSNQRFEHLISGASKRYLRERLNLVSNPYIFGFPPELDTLLITENKPLLSEKSRLLKCDSESLMLDQTLYISR